MPTKFLSVTKAAERANVDPRRVREMCAAGKIPGAQQIGREWAIPEGSVAKIKVGPQGWAKGRKRKAKKV